MKHFWRQELETEMTMALVAYALEISMQSREKCSGAEAQSQIPFQ
jgi:hypothetical protein